MKKREQKVTELLLEQKKKFFEYTDYRKLLKDIFAASKKEGARISLQNWALKLKVSKTFVKYILDGKRHLALDMVVPTARFFKMSTEEEHYLTFLLCKNSVKEKKIGELFEGILSTLRFQANDPQKEILNKDLSNEPFFSNSLGMVIHALAKREDFKPTLAWLRPLLTADIEDYEILTALDFLLNEKILYEEGGKWKYQDFKLCGPGVGALTSFSVFKVGLETSLRVLEHPEMYRPSRFFQFAVPVTQESRKQALEDFIAFRDKLLQHADNCQSPTDVLFASCNLFGMLT